MAILLWGSFTGLILLLHSGGIFRGPNHMLYDLSFHVRNAVQKEGVEAWRRQAAKTIVIVTVDDLSLDLLGIEKSPTRRQWAKLLAKLSPSEEGATDGAVIVAFDYYMPKLEYPPRDMAFINRNLVVNATRMLETFGGLLLPGGKRDPGDMKNLEGEGVLHDLGIVDVAYQEYLRDHEEDHVRKVYRLLKEREKEISEKLDAGEEELFEALRGVDARIVEVLNADEEGLVYRLRRLYGTLLNTLVESDIQLCASMLSANNVILAKWIMEGGLERESDPLFIAAAVDQGFINMVKDSDGKIRSIPFVRRRKAGDAFVDELALSVIAAKYFEETDFDKVFWDSDGFHLGGHVLPKTLKLHINYVGDAKTFPYIPLYRVLHEDILPGVRSRIEAEGVRIELPLRREEIDGKIVLVGDTSIAGQDFIPTPFSSERAVDVAAAEIKYRTSGGHLTETPGVEMHANAIFSILNDTFIHPVGEPMVALIVVAMGVLSIVFYLPRIGLVLSIFVFVLLVAGLLALTLLLFADNYLWIRPAAPLSVVAANFVSGLAFLGVLSQLKKKAITNIFGKYVSDNLVKKMVNGALEVDLKGRTREVTVLFSDIRGFTKLSEKLDPETVGALLHIYFSRMIKTIFLHEGTLDKLMGDAIMAFFGDPEEQTDHPEKAADAALEMLRQLSTLKQESEIDVLKDFAIGIGLNTGMVTVGNLGSDEYVDYTVIGDNVNLGSRLEGLNKEYNTSIIISEFTRGRLVGKFETRSLGRVRVVGKTRPVEIFELLGRTGEVPETALSTRDLFEKGLGHWHGGEFDEALALFGQVEEKEKGGPARTFVQRCRAMIESPPEEEWDGVFVPKTK
jgi:adenylate cyclase